MGRVSLIATPQPRHLDPMTEGAAPCQSCSESAPNPKSWQVRSILRRQEAKSRQSISKPDAAVLSPCTGYHGSKSSWSFAPYSPSLECHFLDRLRIN
jgi:hypothetical protein